MLKVVSAEEMRWCDETAIHRYGIPSMLLMENAGRGVTEFLDAKFGSLQDKRVLILCGKGNNGGDGFVVARHLAQRGAEVTVMLIASPSEFQGDAKRNFEILRRLSKEKSNSLELLRFSLKALKSTPRPHVIVDAIFGTGFSGSVRKPQSDAIRWMNSQGVPVVSVDIPSGVNGSTGIAGNFAVSSNATVTFGLLKSGLLCNQGRELSGEIKIADIGIPPSVVDSERLKTFLVRGFDVAAVLPKRPLQAHKYSVGKVFVLAGSKGYVGAAAMTAQSALRAGAGAVVLGTPETVYSILARKLTEVIVTPLPPTEDGSLSNAAFGKISERLTWADVLAIGPGLSQNRETQELVVRILRNHKGRVLVDADGLNAIAAVGADLLRKTKAEIVVTPHSGELSRLTGKPSKEIEKERVQSARDFASRNRLTIVLKGAPTATAIKDGRVFLNSTGNPGMATVGSGDVLSGMIASLWAQGMKTEEAAYSGVYLHGKSGDLARDRLGERGMVANDLIDFLPEAIRSVESIQS